MPKQHVTGQLMIHADGYGFLDIAQFPTAQDGIYVSIATIRRYRLVQGDQVDATLRWPEQNERYPSVTTILHINGEDMERVRAQRT